MHKLVLFDIDGTLLLTDGAGRAAIRAALLEEFGTAGPIDRFRFDGKTDPQIVGELLCAAGHPAAHDPAQIGAVCRRYAALLARELERRTARVRLFPGVVELLDALDARGDALLGLLTGNVVEGARLKLRAAGLEPARFRVGAFGSDAAHRPDLAIIAARRAVPLMGREPRREELVIVGDTPADMTCGRALGARAIGVATGAFSTAALERAGAYAAFRDLANAARVIAAMYA